MTGTVTGTRTTGVTTKALLHFVQSSLKLLQKVRSFSPLIINERLLEAGILLSPKMVILEYNLKGIY